MTLVSSRTICGCSVNRKPSSLRPSGRLRKAGVMAQRSSMPLRSLMLASSQSYSGMALRSW
jgi:hypothetical protein